MRETPPNQDELQEMEQLAQDAVECLGLITGARLNFDDTAAVVRTIRQCVTKIQEGAALPRAYSDLEQVAYALGTLWGDALCRTRGWQWVHLQFEDGFDGWAVVSPDRAYACFSHHFIYGKLANPDSDNTVALAFNLIVADDMPVSSPGAYTVLAGPESNDRCAQLDRKRERELGKPNEEYKRLEYLYQKAERLYGTKGKEKQAIEAYEAYLQEVPDDAVAWSELGALNVERSDILDALRCFQRAIEIAPDTSRFWMQKASLLSSLNRSQKDVFTHLHHLKDEYKKHFASIEALRKELVRCYEKVLELASSGMTFDYRVAMRERARVCTELGRHRDAIEAYEHLVQIEENPSERASYLFSIALQYEELGNWSQALDFMDQCLNEKGDFILTHKARVLQKAGREREALETHEAFLEAVTEKIVQTQEPAYYFQKVTVLKDLGRVDEAVECLRSLLKRGDTLTPSTRAQTQERIKALAGDS